MTGKPTQRQSEARMRNWGIRNLRALYCLANQLSPERRRQVQAIIDDELRARGADTMAEQAANLRRRWESLPDEMPPITKIETLKRRRR